MFGLLDAVVGRGLEDDCSAHRLDLFLVVLLFSLDGGSVALVFLGKKYIK